MKAVLVLVLVALAAAAQATVVHTKATRKLADADFLKRQKNILGLLFGLGHEHMYKSEFEDFDLKSSSDLYNNPNVVKEFWYEYEHGFLQHDREFSLDSPKILRQTIKLFDIFYFAKDFDTFYKTASWARQHVHDTQFAYAYYIAVYHRPDCRGIVLPPLYEVFPSSFITEEVMHKIFDAKMEGIHSLKVYMNTTGWEEYWHKMSYGYEAGHETFNHVEERLSYFREDVGLNDFLAQFTVFYPRWLDQHKYPKIKYFRRGELFYYVMQQLLARYSLERYVNYMPKTDMLYWDQPITVGYHSRVLSPSGFEMYPRAYNMVPRSFNPSGVWKAETYEWKIHNDIDSGVIFYNSNSSYGKLPLEEVINTWGNVIWGTPDAYDHEVYGSYFLYALEAVAHIVKTGSIDDYVTGPMGYSFTAARDPAFYMLLNRIMHIFQHHKDALPAYTKKDLTFPGVKVESLEVGKLTTYFDRFDIEATYGVPMSSDKSYKDYHYFGMQARLNHKPFTYKLTVSSDRPVEAIVRTFIGPKYDSEDHPLTCDEARHAFVELDRFPVKLANGENVIERNSKESTGFIDDKEGFGALYGRIENSMTTQEAFYVTDSYECGLPERLMIPKGSPEGRPLVFYTVVTPYEHKFTTPAEERQFESQIFCGGSKYYDGRPYGFPFDRRVDYEEVYNVPNFHSEDVLVYHKYETEINRSQ